MPAGWKPAEVPRAQPRLEAHHPYAMWQQQRATPPPPPPTYTPPAHGGGGGGGGGGATGGPSRIRRAWRFLRRNVWLIVGGVSLLYYARRWQAQKIDRMTSATTMQRIAQDAARTLDEVRHAAQQAIGYSPAAEADASSLDGTLLGLAKDPEPNGEELE